MRGAAPFTARKRFPRTVRFQPVRRAPCGELRFRAQTVDRWQAEGMPPDVSCRDFLYCLEVKRAVAEGRYGAQARRAEPLQSGAAAHRIAALRPRPHRPMPTAMSGQPAQRTFRLPARAACLLAFLYVYVWRVIDPSLIYSGYWTISYFPVFWVDGRFLREFLVYPGGPAEYVSAFLCQLFVYPWLGAAAITAVAALLALGTWGFVKRLTGEGPQVLHLVPPVLLVLCYNRYANALPPALAMSAAVIAGWLYASAPVRRPARRLGLFLVLLLLVYYGAGGAYLLFAPLCCFFEVFRGRRRALGLACLACAAAAPYLGGALVFEVRPADVYWRLLPFHIYADERGRALVSVLWAFLLLAGPAALLGPAVRSGVGLAAERLRLWGPGGLPRRLCQVGTGRLGAPVALVLVAAVLLVASADAVTRTVLRVEYCSQHCMWPQLLAAAGSLPLERHTLTVSWDVTRALYHTGRLPTDLFRYPQDLLGILPSPRVLPTLKMHHSAWMKLSVVLMELGRVNEAEHLAAEALEMVADHPHILRQLILARAVKGQVEAVRILLGALSKDLLHGRWARQYLRRLEEDPTFAWDPEVQRLRAVMPDTDLVGWFPPEQMLTQLLESNERNRMAFEYLMAHYLTHAEPEKVAANMGRLEGFGYSAIPRHYEEALLLYSAATGKEPDLGRYQISEETRRRYGEFSRVFSRYRRRWRQAEQALGPDYADSYFFYFTFGPPGVAG